MSDNPIESEAKFLSDIIDQQKAEIASLQSIVSKLPVTSDGIPIVPGMELWTVSEHGDAFLHTVKGVESWDDYSTKKEALEAYANNIEAKAKEAREKANQPSES